MHGCNELADRLDFIGITHVVNGGETDEVDREAHFKRARAFLRF